MLFVRSDEKFNQFQYPFTSLPNKASIPKALEKLLMLPSMYQKSNLTLYNVLKVPFVGDLHPPAIENSTPHSIHTQILLSSLLFPYPSTSHLRMSP